MGSSVEMSSSRVVLPALPPDLLVTLSRFLLGIDLLRLSHTSRALRKLLDGFSLSIWTPRLTQYSRSLSTESCAKRALLCETSLRFRGTEIEPQTRADRWSSANFHGLVLDWGEIVAFDLCFSLLPGDDATFAGGVLLGAQSVAYQDPRWPFYQQQFLVVDADCNLFCSLVSPKPLLNTQLVVGRWYHLALMYDGHTQRVYLNGELLNQVSGSIHHEAYSLRCMQLGTGCISAGSPGRPTPTFSGWYGFHGLVDEFRTWGMTLSTAAIQKLAKGEMIEERPRFSLRYSSGVTPKGGAKHVHCSRPLERVCSLYS